MELISTIAKIVIFLGILNVWFVRFNKSTAYRGGGAGSMKEEFKTYGLSEGMMYAVGALKVSLATLLLISIWVPVLSFYAAAGMAILMLGAISMHIKVKDELSRSLPATIMLLLSVLAMMG
ncbi:MAG: DoxX family protein [Cyclonatronaceae bacterium]